MLNDLHHLVHCPFCGDNKDTATRTSGSRTHWRVGVGADAVARAVEADGPEPAAEHLNPNVNPDDCLVLFDLNHTLGFRPWGGEVVEGVSLEAPRSELSTKSAPFRTHLPRAMREGNVFARSARPTLASKQVVARRFYPNRH